MPKRKQYFLIAGAAVVALLFLVPMASAASNSSVPEMLREVMTQLNYVLGNMTTSINDGNSDLELKLWSGDNSVKNDTKQMPDVLAQLSAIQGNLTELNSTLVALNDTMTQMNSTMSQGTKTVTGYYQVFIPYDTPAGYYELARIIVHGDAAAHFTFGVVTYDDFTATDGDYVGVAGMIWENYHYFGVLEDNQLVGGWIDCSFTATEARVVAYIHDVVPSNNYVWITYTITTSADAELEIVPSEI